jgi:hypothetical protein
MPLFLFMYKSHKYYIRTIITIALTRIPVAGCAVYLVVIISANRMEDCGLKSRQG